MAVPTSLENTIRIHDEAFNFWLGHMTVDYGSISGISRPAFPILRIMAAPDRVWASTVEQLVKQGWIDAPTVAAMREKAANDFAVLPLPIVSIVRADPVPYPEGGGVPKRFRRQQFLQPTQQWAEHPWPGSYRTEYRATFWSAKRYTEAFMREWVMSQLGQLGAADTEVFIPVQHGEPWGTLSQALKYESSSDLSNLEGEEPRYIRYEMTFTLNTLHFRPASATYDFQDTIATGVAFMEDVDATEEDPLDQPGTDLVPAWASGNLYAPYVSPPLIPTRWPKAGDATVANSTVTPDGRPDPGALVLDVSDPADQVDLLNRPIKLDADDHAVLSVAFKYRSDAAVDLDVQQHDGSDPTTPTWSRRAIFGLPASPDRWLRFNQFTVVTEPIFDVAFIGTGVDATLRVAGTKVRHIHSGTKLTPTSSVVLGNVRYAWAGLTDQPYLVLAVITPAAASGTLTIENDGVSPSYTKAVSIDDTLQLSAVFLVQPKTTSLVLRVPVAFTIAAVYAQRYDGGYAGHDL